MMVIVSIISWIAPELITMNGEKGSKDIVTSLILGLFGILLMLIFLLLKDRFAILEIGNQKIKINHKGQEKVIDWLEVAEVDQMQGVYPPLYKIKTKEFDRTLWFNTEVKYLSICGSFKDKSEMGDLIQKKKKELEI
jgi:hypothetical protein